MQKSLQSCRTLKASWAQLGSNLDLLLRKAPVELFKQGLACRAGVRALMGPRMP
jgi:hypothetical protein